VIDELHLLHQGSRGARLEALITRATRLNPFIRMIGLSATLANLDELAEWLRARRYRSSWRLVPVTKRVRRFSKPADKPRMLLEEIQETTLDKGKVLVFVNSRKRAESLAKHLQQSGIHAAFHHAGLPRGERLSTEATFRNGPVDVLIATSTLEMGLNLPARKVVLYDSYAFADNGSFEALPVINYVQRTGRAGRPGLDTEGESVFFLPAWAGNSKCYESEELEPILSTLFDENLLAGQVLAEISSRIAITRTQLERGFGDRTLWRFQGGKHRLDNIIDLLARSAMVKETAREGLVFLSATAIGRLGTQLFLSPKSTLAIKNCYECCDSLFLFDLLLITSLLPECEPRLWFDFEEIDSSGDQLLSIPSFLLDQSQSFLRQCFGQGEERHLLSALKMAALLHGRILGLTDEELMDAFSCYATSTSWLKMRDG
jgi:helicase